MTYLTGPESILVVYNPSSGYLLDQGHDSLEACVRSVLETIPHLSVEFLPFQAGYHHAVNDRIRTSRPSRVWVAGGDGTVNSIAGILMHHDIPMGILPGGTVNLLARDLGMNLDICQAAHQLSTARPERIDVAMLNDRIFLCISNIGISTILTARREQLRRTFRWIRWPLLFWYVIKALADYPVLTVEMKIEGHNHLLKTRSISVSNNLLEDDSILIPSRRNIDQGRLGIYAARDTSPWSVPRLMLKLVYGRWREDIDLVHFQSGQADITCRFHRRMLVMTDGEIQRTSLPLNFRILPAALTILRPGES